jgi:hypothetical protein
MQQQHATAACNSTMQHFILTNSNLGCRFHLHANQLSAQFCLGMFPVVHPATKVSGMTSQHLKSLSG